MLVIGLRTYPECVLNLAGNLLLGLVGFKRGRSTAPICRARRLMSLPTKARRAASWSEESGVGFIPGGAAELEREIAVQAIVAGARERADTSRATDAMLREILPSASSYPLPVYEGMFDHQIIGTIRVKDLMALLRRHRT